MPLAKEFLGMSSDTSSRAVYGSELPDGRIVVVAYFGKAKDFPSALQRIGTPLLTSEDPIEEKLNGQELFDRELAKWNATLKDSLRLRREIVYGCGEEDLETAADRQKEFPDRLDFVENSQSGLSNVLNTERWRHEVRYQAALLYLERVLSTK